MQAIQSLYYLWRKQWRYKDWLVDPSFIAGNWLHLVYRCHCYQHTCKLQLVPAHMEQFIAKKLILQCFCLKVSMCDIILRVGCTNSEVSAYKNHWESITIVLRVTIWCTDFLWFYWIHYNFIIYVIICSAEVHRWLRGRSLGSRWGPVCVRVHAMWNATSEGQTQILLLRELSVFFMCVRMLTMESRSLCHVSTWQGVRHFTSKSWHAWLQCRHQCHF